MPLNFPPNSSNPADPINGDVWTDDNGLNWQFTSERGWSRTSEVTSFTLSTLPAVATEGRIVWVNDATPPVHAAFDGAVWMIIGTNTPVS